MDTIFSLEALRRQPTLQSGHFDNLKIESGTERIWLSRCTREDGMCCDAHVTVEKLVDGVWTTTYEECHS